MRTTGVDWDLAANINDVHDYYQCSDVPNFTHDYYGNHSRWYGGRL
jgi:hypothetical protein